MKKIKAHFWTLPRWFALPLFAAPAVLGGLLAGGMTFDSWLGVIGTVLIMAGGHSFNSFLDYAWTGLDKGEVSERSAEKDYAAGQSIIAAGIVSAGEVAINALAWYALALVPIIYLAVNVGWPILLIGALGMLSTFFYSKAKFNWMHEFALGTASGPLAVLAGMFATNASPPWVMGLVVSVPSFILISFVGLAIDEWPDAEANLKKGVRSISYKVWEYGVSLEWYLSVWILFMFLYQVFLISIGFLQPLSAISFFVWPFLISFVVMLKRDFRKWAGIAVFTGVMYPVLMVLGHWLGTF
ncbi:MAG TPA: prenyltransferase [Dehalococcoidales bacterium]|nr:prenyltransferase [Dehalococcoidales bacterium]